MRGIGRPTGTSRGLNSLAAEVRGWALRCENLFVKRRPIPLLVEWVPFTSHLGLHTTHSLNLQPRLTRSHGLRGNVFLDAPASNRQGPGFHASSECRSLRNINRTKRIRWHLDFLAIVANSGRDPGASPVVAGRCEAGSASVSAPSLRFGSQPPVLIAGETLRSHGIPGLAAAGSKQRRARFRPWRYDAGASRKAFPRRAWEREKKRRVPIHCRCAEFGLLSLGEAAPRAGAGSSAVPRRCRAAQQIPAKAGGDFAEKTAPFD